MNKYTVTYHASKTKNMAITAVDASQQEIRNDTEPDLVMLQKLAGQLAYCTVFNIPEYKLEDNKAYSIENIVFYIPGIFKNETYLMLQCLGDISVNVRVLPNLKKLFENPFLPELLSDLGVNSADVFCALLIMYYRLKDDNANLERVRSVSKLNGKFSDYFNVYLTS